MTVRLIGIYCPESTKPLTAARDGFSLNAALACKDHERDKLERLCRYVARGPIALERLSIDGDGLVVYALKHPFRDGTTHVCRTWMYECRARQDAGSGLFEPLDFIARLAALVPRPRTHLVRYHGLFAPNAKHRHLIVDSQSSPPAPGHGEQASESLPTAPMTWMQRLRRVFEIDSRVCPRCAGPVRVIAAVTEPALISSILQHLDRRDGSAAGARAPPAQSLH